VPASDLTLPGRPSPSQRTRRESHTATAASTSRRATSTPAPPDGSPPGLHGRRRRSTGKASDSVRRRDPIYPSCLADSGCLARSEGLLPPEFRSLAVGAPAQGRSQDTRGHHQGVRDRPPLSLSRVNPGAVPTRPLALAADEQRKCGWRPLLSHGCRSGTGSDHKLADARSSSGSGVTSGPVETPAYEQSSGASARVACRPLLRFSKTAPRSISSRELQSAGFRCEQACGTARRMKWRGYRHRFVAAHAGS
jgi:hypothetical protein